ncbi:MAG TPA: hypothetical protein VJ673_09945 [Aromatoleum sp.]|uniref:hypothetical protein n=1 Tax=Aromatoleum sp. TaxID=2307007 RepID=UPI002B463635|nr:hypothetical protein [Aromatoleum sp.]HJV26002.1 hypothetical protein [Aromatoleum sp.]
MLKVFVLGAVCACLGAVRLSDGLSTDAFDAGGCVGEPNCGVMPLPVQASADRVFAALAAN